MMNAPQDNISKALNEILGQKLFFLSFFCKKNLILQQRVIVGGDSRKPGRVLSSHESNRTPL